MESIIVAIITGGLTLLGTIISNISSNKKIETNLKIQQAVTDTKIEALTSEVREHNNFAKKNAGSRRTNKSNKSSYK